MIKKYVQLVQLMQKLLVNQNVLQVILLMMDQPVLLVQLLQIKNVKQDVTKEDSLLKQQFQDKQLLKLVLHVQLMH